MAVVNSTVVRWSDSQKFNVSSTEGLVLHMACSLIEIACRRERIKAEKAIESEGKEELMKKGKHDLCNATHVRQSARDVWTI